MPGKHKARWQLVTGNTAPSVLSIASYFENSLPGKPIGRDGFVNCGGEAVI